MQPQFRNRLFAAGLAVVAAFLWATYYSFVLAVEHRTTPSAILFYPFLSGGVAYAGWAVLHRQGTALVRKFLRPAAYLRLALLFVTQVLVLGATYFAGPVDASLFSLLGDVVATPLVVALLYASERRELRAPVFGVGLVLSAAGGTLAIAGGQRFAGVHDLGWVVAFTLPLTVAFYFLLSARSGESDPVPVVVGQVTVAAAVVALAVAPLAPGGLRGIVAIGTVPLLLMLVNGTLTFFLAPLCYFEAIRRAGFALPPLLMTGIPVFTLLLSATILGVAPAPLALVGVPIAVVGGVLALSSGGGAGASATASP